MMSDRAITVARKGFLGMIERAGNRLPDPVFLFFYLILALTAVSVACTLAGVSAIHPTQLAEDGNPLVIRSVSLLSAGNIQRLWVDMPKTFTHFHPLGYVLVVMLGAGVAERSGLFASAIRSAVRGAPKFLLTPVVALVAMISNHAADAGYVVLIPLAAVLFASAGRHPLAGIAAAFAGVSGGFSANISPGQLDALLFGITESAVAGSGIDSHWAVNIAGNTYFIIALMFLYLPIIWFVTDKVIEPRLGSWVPDAAQAQIYSDEDKPLTAGQRKGLGRAGLACLGVVALWTFMTLGPGTPLLASGPGSEDLQWHEQDDIEILLINPKTGEHTTMGHMGGSSGGGFGWLTMRRDLRIDDWPDRQTSDPRTFLEDARLYLIGRRHGGTVCVPFEMPDIKLEAVR